MSPVGGKALARYRGNVINVNFDIPSDDDMSRGNLDWETVNEDRGGALPENRHNSIL